MGLVPEEPPRLRLGVDDRRPDVVGVRERQQLPGRLEEDRGDRRVEGAARTSGPPSRRPGSAPPTASNMTAAKPTAANRAASDTSSPASPAGAPCRRSARRHTDGPAHGCGQTQPPVRSAPTSQSARADSSTILATRGARASTRSFSTPEPSPARNRSASSGRVASIRSPRERTAMSSPPKRGGRLVRGRRASGKTHQARVEDLALPNRRQPGPARQFGRQQAGAHRLTRRVAASQVTGHRQRRDHTGNANLPGHRSESRRVVGRFWVARWSAPAARPAESPAARSPARSRAVRESRRDLAKEVDPSYAARGGEAAPPGGPLEERLRSRC